jgi:hypothetical protein
MNTIHYMSLQERWIAQCTGNPGALSLWFYVAHVSQLEQLLDTLVRYDITGSDIWIIYKLKCNKDISTFVSYSFETYHHTNIL